MAERDVANQLLIDLRRSEESQPQDLVDPLAADGLALGDRSDGCTRLDLIEPGVGLDEASEERLVRIRSFATPSEKAPNVC